MLVFYPSFLIMFTVEKVKASIEKPVNEKFRKRNNLEIPKHFCVLNTDMFSVF